MVVRVRRKAGGGSLNHDCCCHSDALKGRANWLWSLDVSSSPPPSNCFKICERAVVVIGKVA